MAGGRGRGGFVSVVYGGPDPRVPAGEASPPEEVSKKYNDVGLYFLEDTNGAGLPVLPALPLSGTAQGEVEPVPLT